MFVTDRLYYAFDSFVKQESATIRIKIDFS